MANNCKIFTPDSYVAELLDIAGYNRGLLGRSVLENSCGDGNILKEVVRRYIADSLERGHDPEEIRAGLEADICGVELEQEHANRCRENLDREAEAFGIHGVNWNIICGNYLKMQLNREFSYVLGNPPYIVYRDIEKGEREYLRRHFESCGEGKFDYYYAFIEKSIHELEENGRMAYIVPSSIYKNVFARRLREEIQPFLTGVYDYTSQNKFPGTTISSTILCIRRQVSADFCYRDMEQEREFWLRKELQGEKWVFDNVVAEGQIRFGDWFQVSNTVATLCNDAFLLEDYRQEDGYYILPNGDRIEEEVVKPAVSRKRRDVACAMIFPYAYEAGELRHYTDEEFRERFPCAVEHLERFRERLKKRASDKNAAWFEYGRGQALQKIQYRKAVIPSILTNRVRVTIAAEGVIPCAGFMITELGGRTLEDARNILESPGFYYYLRQIGIFTTGKSRRLTVKDIENYTFNTWR